MGALGLETAKGDAMLAETQAWREGRSGPVCQHPRDKAQAEGLQCLLLLLQGDRHEYFISFL